MLNTQKFDSLLYSEKPVGYIGQRKNYYLSLFQSKDWIPVRSESQSSVDGEVSIPDYGLLEYNT